MKVRLTDLDRLPFDQRHNLPPVTAVYAVAKSATEVIYVGSSTDLKARWKSHHRRFQIKDIPNAEIYWQEVDKNALRRSEAEWIEMFNPPLNRTEVQGHAKVMVATLLPTSMAATLLQIAEANDRTVSNMVKILIQESPQFQEALRQVEVA